MNKGNPYCYTDYPFVELGDASDREAPIIRQVKILDYDGDRYALVQDIETGCQVSIDVKYLYNNKTRLGKGEKRVDTEELNRLFNGS